MKCTFGIAESKLWSRYWRKMQFICLCWHLPLLEQSIQRCRLRFWKWSSSGPSSLLLQHKPLQDWIATHLCKPFCYHPSGKFMSYITLLIRFIVGWEFEGWDFLGYNLGLLGWWLAQNRIFKGLFDDFYLLIEDKLNLLGKFGVIFN